MDFYILGCPKNEFSVYEYVSVSIMLVLAYVCYTIFDDSLTEGLMERISWNFMFIYPLSQLSPRCILVYRT